MQHFSTRARSLAVALCLAASASTLSIAPALAQDKVSDPGVRCAAKVGPGQYDFYLPGERATDVNGNKWVCGPDGQWFRDYSSIVKAPITRQYASAIVGQATTLQP